RSQYVPGYHPWWSWIARMLPYYEQENLYRVADDWAHSGDGVKPEQFRWDPFGNPPNPAVGIPLKILQCPADSRTELAVMVPPWPGSPPTSFRIGLTGYLGVSGTNNRTFDGILIPNGSYKRNSKIRLADVTDGASNTLLVGERPPSATMSAGWWFAASGQAGDGSADFVLGVRELCVIQEYWQPPYNCARGPYNFRPGNLRNECDAFHFWSPHSGGANFLFADGSVHFLSYTADNVLPALATRSGGEVVTLP